MLCPFLEIDLSVNYKDGIFVDFDKIFKQLLSEKLEHGSTTSAAFLEDCN